MDDDGMIHVFEAMIVGVLVLTAILFMTALSGPTQSQSSGGLDLARIAGDTLDILEARDADCDLQDTPPDPETCTARYENRLEELVSAALHGDSAQAEEFIGEILPSGTRFLLRLDNGVAPMTLLPSDGSITSTPRSARGAESFLMPNWTVHAMDPDPAVQFAQPGDLKSFSSWTLTAPDGSTTGPDGTSWFAWWTLQEPGQDRIPSNVPYGLWDIGGTLLRIHGTSMTDFPVYTVQLLVWPGA